MSLRPAEARWFEMLVLRDDLPAAIDVLARSARVELQSHGEIRAPVLAPSAGDRLEAFEDLAARYAAYWPSPAPGGERDRLELQALLDNALAQLEAWAEAARQTVEKREGLERRLEELRLLTTLFREAEGRLPDLAGLANCGPLLGHCLYRLEPGQSPGRLPDLLIVQELASEDHLFLLGLGLPEAIHDLERRLEAGRARRVDLPDSLPADPAKAVAHLAQEARDAAAEIEACDAALATLTERYDLARAVADVRFVRWYREKIPEQSATEHFAWITGWTSDPDEEVLVELLAGADIKALLRLTEAPPGLTPPLVLENPRWVRPFEVFTRMLGVPGAAEADPTRIVAVASPLMFGYMFGDVGHGLVVLVAGLLLSRRMPALRLLVAGGAVSIVFGFVFGSVFALEGLIPALWLHPMEEPLPVMIVPLFGGAILLLAGMLLEAFQAAWRQQAAHWWSTSAGLVLCYLALLGSIRRPELLWLALAGGLWFVAGHGLVAARQRLAAAGSAAVEFIESMLQLAVNTVSFVRVGAFALAHAGLSMAVVGVSQASPSVSGRVLVLVLGNALIILLEGLVVSIQTTRLVLFEFFVRFMRGEGRPFRPMTPAGLDPLADKRRSL